MALDYVALSLSRKTIKESLIGGGAIVGKNVTISSVKPIDNGNRVTFSYTLDNGEKRESILDVMNGADGDDGFSPTISEDTKNNDNVYKLKISTKDRTFTTPNLIPTIDLSNIVVDIDIVDNVLIVTKGNGETKEIKLPTISSGGNNTPGSGTNNFTVSSLSLNTSKEIEISYTGETTQEFPYFNLDYKNGELYINDNGNNNITFEINNTDLEVSY